MKEYTNDLFLYSEIAKLYYMDFIKQKDIAKIFNITPIQVSRILKIAVEREIVKFHIATTTPLDLKLGKRISDKYGLRECIVIDEAEEQAALATMAIYLSDYIASLIDDNSTVGLSWGKGIYELVRKLPYLNLKSCKVVQLSGGIFSQTDYMVTPSHIVSAACEKIGGIPIFLNAPFFFVDVENKRKTLDSLGCDRISALLQKSTINVFGVSPLAKESTMSRVGFVDDNDIMELRSKGAIGDICGFFINKHGEEVEWSKKGLYSGFSLTEISKAETTVCMAGETKKYEVIKAALNKKYFNVLLTTKSLGMLLVQ